MNLRDFQYDLPPELIASEPLVERPASRLLRRESATGDLQHAHFRDLPNWFEAGDVLVLNDTRVIPARVHGRKTTGGKVEVLLERIVSETRCLVHVKANRSPPPGAKLILAEQCTAEVVARQGEFFELDLSQPAFGFFNECGEMPLPPYLARPARATDKERYQTVYADAIGAVAAPTAGLHFDERLLGALRADGVEIITLTLHVGAGTFQNLRPEQLQTGRLHEERVVVSDQAVSAILAAQAAGRRITAVGTTSTRALEAAAVTGTLASFDGETDLFIQPGFEFRVVDRLITNFHLPGSSLLMLLGAFMGVTQMQRCYEVAIRERYRFYSYGDAMFVDRGSIHEV